VTLSEKIQQDIRAAMKERSRARLGALRMIGAALKNAEIEAGRPLTEEQERVLLRRQLKQREESAEAFRRAGREEQATSELAEAKIVRAYLPEPLAADELEKIVETAIGDTGATGMKDMGAAMGRAIDLAGGRAQGRELAPLVRERLQ
jgi:uncharacterized protein YqeY